MLNPNAELWVKALRYGGYYQNRGNLRTGGQFDVFGVACQLAVAKGVLDSPSSREEIEEISEGITTTKTIYAYDKYEILLPPSVQNWLGLATYYGGYYSDKNRLQKKLLFKLNDMGSTFRELADIIESEPDGLFKE